MERAVIGGDFELRGLALGPISVLSKLTGGIAGTWTASGRAALALALHQLQADGVDHVHLPAYLCNSVLLIVQALGLDYSFYPVDADWTARPDPPQNAAVLLIHYFGWLNPATAALRAEAGRSFHLIEDASQAMLSDWTAPPSITRAVFISPRKFGPTVLGGWVNLEGAVKNPSPELEAIAWRSLAARSVRGLYLSQPAAEIERSVEDFYLAAFQAVETFLDSNPTDPAPPGLVLQLIAGINWVEVAARRRTNWMSLDQSLDGTVDKANPSLPGTVVPLGYVARFRERDAVREKLAAHRIFCPVHWVLPSKVSARRFPDAALLSKSCLTLPIDQRYDTADMDRLGNILRNLGG